MVLWDFSRKQSNSPFFLACLSPSSRAQSNESERHWRLGISSVSVPVEVGDG